MIKLRNDTEREISRVVQSLYAYGTDFPGRIAQRLYDMGYRKIEKEEATDALSRAAVPDATTEQVKGELDAALELRAHWRSKAIEARAERDAALAAIERVRKYADERSVYAKTRNNIVGSWRIASDLYDLLGVSHEEQAELDGAPEPEVKP